MHHSNLASLFLPSKYQESPHVIVTVKPAPPVTSCPQEAPPVRRSAGLGVVWSGSPSERGFSECLSPTFHPALSAAGTCSFPACPSSSPRFSSSSSSPSLSGEENLDLFPACFVMWGSKNFRVFPL